MPGRNPWVVLCVAEDAPFHEVQRAFRLRVKQTHPDGGGDAGEFAAVVRAFDLVRQSRSPRSRRKPPPPTPYDCWLRPCASTASWAEDNPSPTATSGAPAGPGITAAVPTETGDFSTVLYTEMSKAMAGAACA